MYMMLAHNFDKLELMRERGGCGLTRFALLAEQGELVLQRKFERDERRVAKRRVFCHHS